MPIVKYKPYKREDIVHPCGETWIFLHDVPEMTWCKECRYKSTGDVYITTTPHEALHPYAYDCGCAAYDYDEKDYYYDLAKALRLKKEME